MTKCAYCEYNDGAVYTSDPPKYRCTVTGEYHLALDDCNVEFAPIVRCKDCKRYTPFRNLQSGEMDEGECEGYDPCVPANHFCSRGERRENDG